MSAPAVLERQPQLQEGLVDRWFTAAELAPDLESEARQRAAILSGSIAVENVVSIQPLEDRSIIEPSTLLSNLRNAAHGDVNADNVVDLCVGTDVAERLYKVKKHTEIPLARDRKTWQFGQNGEALVEVSMNTMRYGNLNPTMWGRTELDAGNAIFLDLAEEEGLLDEFDILIAYATTDDEKTKEDFNFSVDTDSVSLQLLSGSNGNFVLETALVAGKVAPDADSHALETLGKVGADHGVDLSDQDEDSMHSVIMLIPKGSLEDGMASVVEQYDDHAGGTFYGLAEQRQDYKAFAEASLAQDFTKITTSVKQKLFKEVEVMTTPEDAVQRLNYWSGKFGVEAAVLDSSIDSSVFGEAAAPLIDQARFQLNHGNEAAARIYVKEAKKVEESGSCPIASRTEKNGELSDKLSQLDRDDDDSNIETDSEGEVEMTCPYCKETTKGDPCKRIVCENCDADSTDSEIKNRIKADLYRKQLKASKEVKTFERKLEIETLAKLILTKGGPVGDPAHAQNN